MFVIVIVIVVVIFCFLHDVTWTRRRSQRGLINRFFAAKWEVGDCEDFTLINVCLALRLLSSYFQA
eukprot:scaffold4347_cov269-Ochromonas_danica.AAC.14